MHKHDVNTLRKLVSIKLLKPVQYAQTDCPAGSGKLSAYPPARISGRSSFMKQFQKERSLALISDRER